MRNRSRDTFQVIGAGLLIAAIIALVVFAIYKRHQEIKKCEDNGGNWVEYDCHTDTRLECSYNSDGSLRECHTEHYRHCKERCEGANAEAHELIR